MNGGPQLRVSSPLPGGSTLITSAPMSPSIIVHSGPARMRLRSSTRTPASAPLVAVVIGSGPRLLSTHRGRRVEVFGAAVEVVLKLAFVAQAKFLEVGLAAFEEGVHAFETFLGAPDMGEQLHAVLPGRIEQVGFEVEALFGHPQCLRAVTLDGLAPGERLLHEIFPRHASVDQADRRRLLGG